MEYKIVYNFFDRLTKHFRILDNDSLVFDSHFESGNLSKATRILLKDRGLYNNFQEYNLELNQDLYTQGHIQWYYFSVSNTMWPDVTYKFNITNFRKPDRYMVELFFNFKCIWKIVSLTATTSICNIIEYLI